MRYLMFLFVFSFALTAISFAQTEPKVGTKAPDFTLQDVNGNSYTLSSYINKSPVIVYFYPKAGTSGCTKEACGIRDDWSKFEKNNIQVFGVSVDTKPELEKFIKDYHLNFPLLSDADKKVSKEYGVLRDNGYDKRVTFIIDKSGNINKIIPVTDINDHAQQVFDIASGLAAK
jgi:thioredoxin-dependent peroxiredoxin